MADRIRTVASSGGNYSSLEGCFDGEVGDLVTAQERLWAQCAAFQDSTPVNQSSGWTTNSTYYVYVTADDNHGGVWSTSVYRLVNSTTYAAFLASGIPNVRTEGLQIANTRTSTTSNYALYNGGTDHWHHRAIVSCGNTSTGGTFAVTAGGANFLVTASIIMSRGNGGLDYGFYFQPVTDQTQVGRNCTIWGGTYSARCQNFGGTALMVNCHTSGATNGTVNEETGALSSGTDYNLTDQSSTPTNWGSNSQTSATVALTSTSYTTYPHDGVDARRTTGDDGIDAGVSQSAYFTTDVIGNTWTTWDIGADDVVVGTLHSAAASISATGALSGTCNTVRFGRPSSDISLGSWMTKDGGTSNIYLEIDEATYSDTDYILGTGTYETLLSSIAEPTDHTYHAVHYRYYKKGTSTVNLVVSLYDGTTEIASWTHNNIGASVVDATQYLNTTQASNITSYSNLRIRFSATVV